MRPAHERGPRRAVAVAPGRKGLPRMASRFVALLTGVTLALVPLAGTASAAPAAPAAAPRTVLPDDAAAGWLARQLVDGNVVGTLRDGGDEADIRVRAAERFRSDPTAIAALPLPSPRPRRRRAWTSSASRWL